MPFKSEKQRGFMFANHPKIAERWAKEYGTAIAKKKKRALKQKSQGPKDRN